MRVRRGLGILLLLATACGGGGEEEERTPFDVVRAAPARTAAAGSARMSIDVRNDLVVVVGEGVASLKEPRAETRTLMGSKPYEAVPGIGFVLETRTIGDEVYVQSGLGDSLFGWGHAVTREEAARSEGRVVLPRAAWIRLGPRVPLAHLAGAVDVRADGVEDVRGERTTLYACTHDLAKARDATEDARLRDAIAAEIDELGTSTVAATVWVADDGRVRRVREVLDLSRSKEHERWRTLMVTFDLYDFGVAVDVAAPTPKE